MTVTRIERVLGPPQERDGLYTVPIAVNDDVGDGFPIDISGLRTDDYMKNPVVLYAHDRFSELPVARTTALRRTNRGLVADFEFLPGDVRAQRVKNAWDKGFLRAASVGVRQMEDGPPELVEWSIVPVPADRDCVRSIFGAMLDEVVDPREADPKIVDAPAGEPEPKPVQRATDLAAILWKHCREPAIPAGRIRISRLIGRSESMADDDKIATDAAAAFTAYSTKRAAGRKAAKPPSNRSTAHLKLIRAELDRRLAASSDAGDNANNGGKE